MPPEQLNIPIVLSSHTLSGGGLKYMSDHELDLLLLLVLDHCIRPLHINCVCTMFAVSITVDIAVHIIDDVATASNHPASTVCI